VLVELIGGTTVARDLIKLAIEQGKHVVTANKALIANTAMN
jgi:homoserine dehydrogenase